MVKKKQNLSPEELLEQALVPEYEWPYRLPENWVWVRLPHICKYIRAGGDKPKNATDTKDEMNKIPIVANGIVNDGIIGFTDMPKAEKDTITISARGTIGFSVMRDYEYYPIVRLIVIKPHDFVYPKLVKYMFDNFLEEGTGSSIPQLTVPMLSDKYVPLPPLAEQQRIVDRIESLFEKLDQAKGLIQDALDSFENRKAAILHRAFSGELTKKWREENGVGMESWETKELRDIAVFRSGYAFDSSKFSDNGLQVLRMGNLYNGVLDLSRNPVFIKSEDVDPSVMKRSKINQNDILLTLTGTKYKRDYGYAVIMDESKDLLLNQRILSLTAQSIEAHYLLNYLKTNLFRNVFFSNETGGVNQGNVSSKFVETITIPVPTSEEQKQIVRLLKTMLENEDNANELCDLIDSLDGLKKSVLARAFRGELSTNDPSEESAKRLIEKIFAENGGELK